MLDRNGAGPASAVTDGEARKIVGTGKRDGQSSSHTLPQAQAPIRADIIGDDRCTALGIEARAAAPTLALCRKLIAAGIDSARPLEAYRGVVLSLRVRSIGLAAQLVVDERRMALARWKAPPYAEVPARIAPRQRAATPVAGAAP